MTKRIMMFVVLIVLASAVSASGQTIRWGYIPQTPEGWYYKVQGDQVGMLTADNLGMVRDLSNQLRRSNIRSLADDLRWNGVAYGINTGRGFYPMYDREGRALSERQRIERAAGIITIPAVIGAAKWGKKGGIIGAVIGGGVALLNDSRYRGSDKNSVVTPPLPQQQGQQRYPYPQAGRGPISNPPSLAVGEWRVSNRTSKRAELWDGEQFIARIEPWQSVQVDAPQNGYKAVLLIPNRSGGLEQEVAQIRSANNFNGWDIIAPAVQ